MPTTGPCTGGATCVEIIEDSSIPGCSRYTGMYSTTTGLYTDQVKIRLPPGWNTRTLEALQYALLHELGHGLGLGDHADGTNPCSDDDSVMHSPVACNDSTLSNTVTPTNSLPVTDAVYGGGPRTSCGF